MYKTPYNRRQFIQFAAGSGLALGIPMTLHAQQKMIARTIPVSGEMLPVIGLGTSGAFENVNEDRFNELKNVLSTFIQAGGSVIDTAPTYGDAESVLGRLFATQPVQPQLFLASKISLWSVPKNSRLIVSRIILDTFKSFKMHYPTIDTKRRKELLLIREQLVRQASEK